MFIRKPLHHFRNHVLIWGYLTLRYIIYGILYINKIFTMKFSKADCRLNPLARLRSLRTIFCFNPCFNHSWLPTNLKFETLKPLKELSMDQDIYMNCIIMNMKWDEIWDVSQNPGPGSPFIRNFVRPKNRMFLQKKTP